MYSLKINIYTCLIALFVNYIFYPYRKMKIGGFNAFLCISCLKIKIFELILKKFSNLNKITTAISSRPFVKIKILKIVHTIPWTLNTYYN